MASEKCKQSKEWTILTPKFSLMSYANPMKSLNFKILFFNAKATPHC